CQRGPTWGFLSVWRAIIPITMSRAPIDRRRAWVPRCLAALRPTQGVPAWRGRISRAAPIPTRAIARTLAPAWGLIGSAPSLPETLGIAFGRLGIFAETFGRLGTLPLTSLRFIRRPRPAPRRRRVRASRR